MKKIALVGTPNSGKTALFNLLTQSHQRVANYSGVTVESAEADLIIPGHQATLVDLPGAYSLRPYTEEEKVLSFALQSGSFSGMILVVDSTQPERAIRFLIEVLNETTLPAVIAFNMIDLAEKRGFRYDFKKLSQSLGVPVVSTVAVKRKGLVDLLMSLEKEWNDEPRKTGRFFSSWSIDQKMDSKAILEFYKLSDAILKETLLREGGVDERTEAIDRVVLHPVMGFLVLIAVLALTFQLMFNLAQIPMDWIDSGFGFLSQTISAIEMDPMLKSFLVDGVIAGVGGTIVFLPQILILFTLILFLEDFGFMARAVFLLDYWMGKVGLHGRAFLPLLSSFACAVPGVMATRSIENRKDRVISVLMIPLTTCSARIPVYTLLISAFIPNRPILFGFRLQGLVMLGLYLTGIFFALISGAIIRKLFWNSKRSPLLIELPSYKWPSIQSIAKGLVYRARLFLTRVGTIILSLSVVIWVLVTFPNPEESFAYRMGHAIEPLMRPLGFDWKISMAMIPTFAAREVMVSALSTVYSVKEGGAVSNTDQLGAILQQEWPLATGISLLVWFIFAPQCVSTLSTIRRELQSTKLMLGMTILYFGLAYFAAWMAHLVFSGFA